MRVPHGMWVAVLGSLLAWGGAGAADEPKQPVYVGARACGICHDGAGMGHQFSRWLSSKHASAHATLALPESTEIARLSGIRGQPQESVLCLGCHATAADAEDWEKDPAFRLEDGVQCEQCHGPGSEYVAPEVMRDGDAARRHGLRMPAAADCRRCHYEKGSHVAVHKRPLLDHEQAMAQIAHPTPDPARMADPPRPSPDGGGAASGGPRHVGVMACASCHRGPGMGHQFSLWRRSAHARAYAVLATPAALEIAAREGIAVDPQAEPRCLSCHTTGPGDPPAGALESFALADGVGCESCHGAGSQYMAEAVMRDPRAARAAGLQPVGPDTCLRCHGQAHGKAFDIEAALRTIAHPTRPPPRAEAPRYRTPVNLALSPDGREIYVACEASDIVAVIDTAQRRMVDQIPVGGQPHDVCFGPDGQTAYVSNRLDDTVSVLDTATRTVRATLAVGDEPHGLLTDRSGSFLYVLNTAADSISVVDLRSQQEVKRLAASRNPWSLALAPDGRRMLVTNNLARFTEFRAPSSSEVSILAAERAAVEDRVNVAETNLLQGACWHPDGRFGLVTMNRTKSLVPMTRILQGWTITNGLAVVWADGRVDQVLLDEPNLCFPDAADVAISPDGRRALASSSGSDRVAVVDVAKLVSILEAATPAERVQVLPNHLGKSTEFVLKHIDVGASPRGIVIDAAGRTAYVANALDDSLTVIDLDRLAAAARIDLGGPREISTVRRGERLFFSANITFQRQFSCHSCHPDDHVDGITYDIEPDGIGIDPVDNRTLRGILDTPPFKWTGKNPSLARQCGARLAVFFTRLEPFAPEDLAALTSFVCTIPRPPNRYRPLGAPLTEAQRRGRVLFYRTKAADGRALAEDQRCVTCHPPPLYTDRSIRDVGTKSWLDSHGRFDVPHLSNIYDSAPYLHNGIAETLEEIWTRFNPEDRHGVTNDLTKDQLNDLVEYLRTL